MRPNVERVILRYHRRLSDDSHHRYRSWGHCYRYFRRRFWLRDQRDLRDSTLQLGFYLASWGMYRGSTFLLQKDFGIHRRAVQILRRRKFDRLLGYRPSAAASTARTIDGILALVKSIQDAYRDIEVVDGRRRKVWVSDTLATKIILGTIACIPAYDAFVVEGMRLEHIPYSAVNRQTLEALFDWYLSREGEFQAVQRRIDEDGLRYPPMKLVDMYLWERGRRNS